MNKTIEVYSDAFPPELLKSLITLIDTSQARKLEFDTLTEKKTPTPIRQAADHVSSLLGLDFNIGILKWYRLSDTYQSEAYEPHYDPIELRSIPLVLCTLQGSAELQYWCKKGDGPFSVDCFDNSITLLDSSLKHEVSVPTNPNGQRYYLFLGYRQTEQSISSN